MVFGFGPAKTKAFDTGGMKFDVLKRNLDQVADDLDLDSSAQIRWTAENGIYAKSGTRNVSGNALFGSDVYKRGEKFLGAHAEIARSINLAFDFTLHEGKPIGDYLVDNLLKVRVQEESSATDIDDLDEAELQRRKQSIYLRRSDLEILQAQINTIRNRQLAEVIRPGGRFVDARDEIARSINFNFDFALLEGKTIGDHLVDNLLRLRMEQAMGRPITDDIDEGELERVRQNIYLSDGDLDELQKEIDATRRNSIHLIDRSDRLTSSVGYVHGKQTDAAIEIGTEALLKSAERDILAQKKRDVSDRDFQENREKYEEEAKKEAQKILRRVGMKTITDDEGNNVHRLAGGLTKGNAEKVSLLLHFDGVTDLNTTAIRLSTALPSKINVGSARLFALDKKLDGLLPHFGAEETRPQLENDLDDCQLPEVLEELCAIRDEIRTTVQENRNLMLDLKKMSFPDDVTNWKTRQKKYDCLAANIKKMDNALARLNVFVEAHPIRRGLPLYECLKHTFNTAQEFCLETLALADYIRPLIQPEDYKATQPRPFHMSLPGLAAVRRSSYFEELVDAGLNHQAEAPEILFKADSTDEEVYSNLIRMHNQRIQRIKDRKRRRRYLDLANRGPKHLSKSDRKFVREYHQDLCRAFNDNENLAGDIERRQKILGETDARTTGAASIDQQLYAANVQRNALLFLIHPHLVPLQTPEREALRVNCKALEAAFDDLGFWQSQLADAGFRRAEKLQEGENRISDEIENTIKLNNTLVSRVFDLVKNGKLDGASRRKISNDLWANFASLVVVKQRLEALRSGLVEGPIVKSAERALEKLDEYIVKVHGLAYALSTKDIREDCQNGLSAYPRSAIDNFDRERIKKGFIGTENHKIKDYAKELDENNAEKDLAEAYLGELEAISGHRFELDQVPSEQHREIRIKMLRDRLIPDLNKALEKNAELSVKFRGYNFDMEYDPNTREADIVARLAFDRTNLQRLRLNAYMMLESERRQMQPGADAVVGM